MRGAFAVTVIGVVLFDLGACAPSSGRAVHSMVNRGSTGGAEGRAPVTDEDSASPTTIKSAGLPQAGDSAQTKQDSGMPPGSAGPPGLNDVLNSVDRHFPLLLAVQQEREIAAGRVTSAEGGFDPTWKGELETRPEGFYRWDRLDSTLVQPTPYWGTTLFAGYRWGVGDFPSYYGDYETDQGGEVRAGLKVPILQGGTIDSRRVELIKARIEREIAEPVIQAKRIGFFRKAAGVYWKWVAAGRKLEVAQSVLRIALDRNDALARRVERGDLAAIELTNNEQLIAQRRAAVIEAERVLRGMAIELSLYWRDDDGRVLLPSPGDPPPEFPLTPTPEPDRAEDDIQTALARRPELRELDLVRRRTEADLQLATNKLLPKVDLTVAASQDDGMAAPKKDKSEAEIQAKLEFEVPLWLREARGKIRETRGKLARNAADRQFAGEQITAEVRAATNDVAMAYRRLLELAENLRKAQEVEEAEQRLFDLGNSNLLNVQLREQATFDAARLVVDATEGYFQAVADHRAALGLDAGGGEDETQPSSD